MALQDDITFYNKLFKEYDAVSEINKMNKLLEKTAPQLNFRELAITTPLIFDRYEGLLASVFPMREQISKMAELIELTNPFRSILNNNLFGNTNFDHLINEINTFAPSLSLLSNQITLYDDVISKQREAFSKIQYLLPYEKRMFLQHEKKQKETLLLCTDDFENTDAINFDVTNTIGFVNSVAHTDNQDIDNTKEVESIECILFETLQSKANNYLNILEGAKQAALSKNPDKVRHTVTSLRELTTHILHNLSPDEEIKKWSSNEEDYFEGRPTRKCRVSYIFRNLKHSKVSCLIEYDIKFIDDFFRLINKGTHELMSNLNDDDLKYLINKFESTILLLLRYSAKE